MKKFRERERHFHGSIEAIVFHGVVKCSNYRSKYICLILFCPCDMPFWTSLQKNHLTCPILFLRLAFLDKSVEKTFGLSHFAPVAGFFEDKFAEKIFDLSYFVLAACFFRDKFAEKHLICPILSL